MESEMSNIFKTSAPHLVTEHGDKLLFPFSPPIFQSEVDTNFIKELIDKGNELTREEDDWRDNLAGNMKHGGSYIYKDDFILKTEPYLMKYIERFFDRMIEQFGHKQVDRLLDVQVDRRQKRNGILRLDTMWINYQHKFDFNPPHTHRGDLSFVIYCKVPKNIFKEQAVSNTREAGKILFQYGEQAHPFSSTLFPVEPYEGLILIFPANMNHYVPSFWTNDERISVAGNFVVATK